MQWARVLNGKIKSLSANDIILTDEEVNSGVIVVQVSDDAQVDSDAVPADPSQAQPPAS